ncbi:hypothetical protein IJG14_01720 [bacterium]|nr:hypothetical protein [bacterium]
MAIEQNKNYTLKGSQLEDLARRLNSAQENASDALEGLDDKVDKETGKGLSTNDFTNSDKTKLDSVEANAQENIIESVSVNGTEITPDANKNVNINVPAIENSLTSESTTDALSAAQGKVLKELIDGASGIKTLTMVDYNWPTANPTMIGLCQLDPGIYYFGEDLHFSASGTIAENIKSGSILLVAQRSTSYPNHRMGLLMNSAGGWTTLSCVGADNIPYTQTDPTSQDILIGSSVVNNLTTLSSKRPLSAMQGKVLNEKIGGDLSNLTTEDKTSLINAINEIVSATISDTDYNALWS